MFQRFKAFYCAASVIFLSLYCRAVLALDETVNASVNTAPTAPPVPTPPAPVTAPPVPSSGSVSTLLPQQLNNKQVLEGIFMMIGSMFFMIAVVWMLIALSGRIFGKKLVFKKPLILGAVGLVLVIIGRHLVK